MDGIDQYDPTADLALVRDYLKSNPAMAAQLGPLGGGAPGVAAQQQAPIDQYNPADDLKIIGQYFQAQNAPTTPQLDAEGYWTGQGPAPEHMKLRSLEELSRRHPEHTLTSETPGDEAQRLVSEYAGGQNAVQGGFGRNVASPLARAGLQFYGPALRPFVGNEAQRQAQVLGQAEEMGGAGGSAAQREAGHQWRGAFASGLQMAGNLGVAHLTKGGLSSVALLSGLQQADQSYTEARDSGMSNGKALLHAAAMGGVEAGITLLANRFMPTGEKMGLGLLKGELLHGGVRKALFDFTKTVLGENAEELVTNFMQKAIEKIDGVDRKEWTVAEAGRLLLDTVTQTTATVGLMSGASAVAGGIQQRMQNQQPGQNPQQSPGVPQGAPPPTPQQHQQAQAAQFVGGLSPEQVQQLAQVTDPTRTNIAKASGIDRNHPLLRRFDYRQAIIEAAQQRLQQSAPQQPPTQQGQPPTQPATQGAQPPTQPNAQPNAPADLFNNPRKGAVGGQVFQPGQGEVKGKSQPWDEGLSPTSRGDIVKAADENQLDPAVVRHYADGEFHQAQEEYQLKRSIWDHIRLKAKQRGLLAESDIAALEKRGLNVDSLKGELQGMHPELSEDFIHETLKEKPSQPPTYRQAVEKAAKEAGDLRERMLQQQPPEQHPPPPGYKTLDEVPFSPEAAMGSPDSGYTDSGYTYSGREGRKARAIYDALAQRPAGELQGVRELRQATGLDKADFDRVLLDLGRQGMVSLHRHDHVAPLSADELARDTVHDTSRESGGTGEHAKGTYYVGASLRHPAGSEPMGAQQQLPLPPTQHIPTGAQPRAGGINPVPPASVSGTGANPIPLRKVWEAIAHVGNTLSGRKGSKRTGRVSGKRALGQYWPMQGSINVRDASDLRTLAHEVGHQHEMNSDILKGATPQMKDELLRLGKAHYGNRKPRGSNWIQEGYSEWMYKHLLDPADAAKQAPLFTPYAVAEFAKHPEAQAAITAAQQASETWFRGMGAPERVRAQHVDVHSFSRKMQDAADSVKRTTKSDQWNDIADPLGGIDREVERLTGSLPRPSESAHQTFLANRNRATGIVHQFLYERQYLPDRPDVKVGPSMEEIYSPVKAAGEYERVNDFQYALFALESWRHGLNPGISRDDAAQTVKELDSPLFRKVAAEVQQWNKTFNAHVATYDPTMAQGLSAAEAKYGFYLPAKRDMALDELRGTRGGQGGAGGAKTGRISAERTGGGQPVKEQLPQLIADKYALLKRAMQRQVTERLLRQIYKPGATQAGGPAKPLAAFSHWIEETTQLPHNARDFRWTEGSGPGKVVRTFAIQPELQKLLDSLEPAQFTGAMRLVFGLPTQIAKTGWMAASPRYGLIRNPMRDLPEMLIKAPGDVPLSRRLAMIPHYFENWGRAIVGQDNAWMQTAKQLGLESTQVLSEHSPNPTRVMRQIGKGLVWHEPRTWVDGLLRIYDKGVEKIQSAEMAARVETMRVKAEQLGWKPGQALDDDTAIMLALAFKQPMGDYGAKGELFRSLDQIFPLASVPITYGRSFGQALYRDGKLNKTAIGIGLASLTLPTLALWLRNKDEEWYRNLPAYEKYSRLYFADHDSNTGLLWFRNSEAGMLFSAIPEALFDSAYASFAAKGDRKGMERLTDLAKYAVEQALPSGPPVVKEALEQYGNKQFGGGPIVPEREGISKRAPAEQFTNQTSETAKAAGRVTGLSPLRLEHAANAITGGLSKRVTDTGESLTGIKTATREQQLSDLPVVGGLFPSGGLTGNRPKPVEKLYDLAEHLQERQHSLAQPETEPEKQQRLTVENAARAVSALMSERDKATTPPEREALINKAARLAEEALSGSGSRQTYQGVTHAAKYRAETDPVKRATMLFNSVDPLTQQKPMLGHAGVTRSNLDARRQAHAETEEVARTFLKETGLSAQEAYSAYRDAVTNGIGPDRAKRVPSFESRANKLRRLKLALGA